MSNIVANGMPQSNGKLAPPPLANGHDPCGPPGSPARPDEAFLEKSTRPRPRGGLAANLEAKRLERLSALGVQGDGQAQVPDEVLSAATAEEERRPLTEEERRGVQLEVV